jgi:Flp pilus assembly protein protease CpaA
LGYRSILAAAFWVAVAGGLLALTVVAVQKIRAGGKDKPPEAHIPYAPAIALGVLIVLLGKA